MFFNIGVSIRMGSSLQYFSFIISSYNEPRPYHLGKGRICFGFIWITLRVSSTNISQLLPLGVALMKASKKDMRGLHGPQVELIGAFPFSSHNHSMASQCTYTFSKFWKNTHFFEQLYLKTILTQFWNDLSFMDEVSLSSVTPPKGRSFTLKPSS